MGRRGHIRVKGALPVTPSALTSSSHTPTDSGSQEAEDQITISAQGLELRVRNVYTGVRAGLCPQQLALIQGCKAHAAVLHLRQWSCIPCWYL